MVCGARAGSAPPPSARRWLAPLTIALGLRRGQWNGPNSHRDRISHIADRGEKGIEKPPPGVPDGGRLVCLVEVVAQHLRTARVPQLRHRLRLDLPDPLTGDPVDLADLVKGAGLAVGESEAQPDDARLALG